MKDDELIDPETGRKWDDSVYDPKLSSEVVRALTVDCAFEDCDGTHEEVMARVPFSDLPDCPECGADRLGRPNKATRREMRTGDQTLTTSEFNRLSRSMNTAGEVALLDYLAVESFGLGISEWAIRRSVFEETVRKNIDKVNSYR